MPEWGLLPLTAAVLLNSTDSTGYRIQVVVEPTVLAGQKEVDHSSESMPSMRDYDDSCCAGQNSCQECSRMKY